MQRITIGRYGVIPDDVARPAEPVVLMEDMYAGWIEGVRDDGSGWIMWLDRNGNPEVFWPERDESGAVAGTAITLTTNMLDPIPPEYRLP